VNRNRGLVAALALAALALAGLVVPAVARAEGPRLGGSHESMERQHEMAVAQEYGFLETPAEVREYAEEGRLERVLESADLALSNVSFPYARPEVRLFVERLAAQYRAATGEQLVVTSLTRPAALQPGNAHVLSVHPAGMAVDFRIPARTKARAWLEATLLELERTEVLDVTRERTPPHYHVAVYPVAYRAYLERVTGPATSAQPPVAAQPAAAAVSAPVPSPVPASSPATVAAAAEAAGRPGSPVSLLLASAAVGLGFLGVRRRSRGFPRP
jgi:hypothetical protein